MSERGSETYGGRVIVDEEILSKALDFPLFARIRQVTLQPDRMSVEFIIQGGPNQGLPMVKNGQVWPELRMIVTERYVEFEKVERP